MGYMRHHAIVVTSWNKTWLSAAHRRAVDLTLAVTPIVESLVNGYMSFMVCPDGSKEGWPDSDKGDNLRAAFIRFLQGKIYEDGSSALDWVEVFYGDEDDQVGIVNDSKSKYRTADLIKKG